MNTNRFNTTREQLAVLGSQFSSAAFPLLKKFYLVSFWIVLSKRLAKKLVKGTFKLAIDYCDKTKNNADWSSWIHRIWMRLIIDYYAIRENDINTNFDFIDHAQINQDEINRLSELTNSNANQYRKVIIKNLGKMPAVLRIPLIMKEIHCLNYKTISDLIDVPEGVIATRIYRARKLFALISKEKFNYEKYKMLNKDYSEKIIFDLRRCALYVDDELEENEKNKFEEFRNDDQHKSEILIQQKVKSLLENFRDEAPAINRLQASVKRKAEKKFGSY